MNRRVYYADESEHAKGLKFLDLNIVDKIFVLGGYSIPHENIKKIKEICNNIKIKYNIPPSLPLKWNFRDNSIKKLYINMVGENKYSEIIKSADEIRQAILSKIANPELDMQIIVSGSFKDIVPKKGKIFYTECFTNFLQRVGLDLKFEFTDDAQVVIDTQPDDRLVEICNIFTNGYEEGKDDYGNPYHSGPLKLYNVFPTLLFGSDLHSDELQIADMIVGLVKDFLNWVKYDKEESKVKKFFPIIKDIFRKDRNGKIIGYGIIIDKASNFPNLEDKFNKLMNLV